MNTARHTGTIQAIATALEPIVHGAGTAGNIQLLRMQEFLYIDDDGEFQRARVPFISGNSLKHRLRDAAVRYALDAMGVADGSLTKAEIDLLFSGGHLSKSGAAVDLTSARKLSELFPPLSLCGYSAGNAMEESKIRVSNLHVVCRENRDRIPDTLKDDPMLALSAGATRVEEFGTRHDQATKAVGRRWLTDGASQAVAERKTKALKGKKGDAPESAADARGDSAQMIYQFEGIIAGAKLWFSVDFRDLTDAERAALASAFHYASTGRRGEALVMGIGAKNSIGYGTIKVELATSLRIAPPVYQQTAMIAQGDTEAAAYTAHLRERKDEILAAIREAVS